MIRTEDFSYVLGQEFTITIDRPLGSCHPEYPEQRYPVNYGYVAGVIGGDGEEQDVYLLGIDVPVRSCQAVVIAVIRRRDDAEDKWVAAPAGMTFTKEEIKSVTDFQERFFQSEIIC